MVGVLLLRNEVAIRTREFDWNIHIVLMLRCTISVWPYATLVIGKFETIPPSSYAGSKARMRITVW